MQRVLSKLIKNYYYTLVRDLDNDEKRWTITANIRKEKPVKGMWWEGATHNQNSGCYDS